MTSDPKPKSHNSQCRVKTAIGDVKASVGNKKIGNCMDASKLIVKAPLTAKQIAAGFSGYKSPNLAETVRHFFDEEIEGAHDALVDARASGRIYWHLKGLEKAA